MRASSLPSPREDYLANYDDVPKVWELHGHKYDNNHDGDLKSGEHLHDT